MSRRRIVLGLATALIALALAGGPALGQAELCQGSRAWPNGPYLGQQDQAIIALYQGTWGNAACPKWAEEHRDSAIRGLRALGYALAAPVEVVDRTEDRRTFEGTGISNIFDVEVAVGRYELKLVSPLGGSWDPAADRAPDVRIYNSSTGKWHWWMSWSGIGNCFMGREALNITDVSDGEPLRVQVYAEDGWRWRLTFLHPPPERVC